VRVIYSPRYAIDIGVHVFPTEKYRLVLSRLLATGVIEAADVIEPEPATWDQLALVHTEAYLGHLRRGTLPPDEVARLELPASRPVIEGFRLMVGGTITAARLACGLRRHGPGGGRRSHSRNAERVVVHLGGGLHHAFPDHGEGFCPFNDVAVAVRVLQREGVSRAAIVDLDVHHGNGTAFVFASDPSVFTCSIHQQHNYPSWKPPGSLDIGLPDGAADGRFLAEVNRALERVAATAPECVLYLAGADPYEDDQLGGLRVTQDGLRQRDRLVIDMCRTLGVPLVITLAGGYARRLEDTVAIHAATVEEARAALAQN
jgi:acetoin utilization deacetylase AcuC-like enzyme